MSDFFGQLAGWFVVIFGFIAWLTHVIVCLKTASWGFLIAGAIFIPVGVIHGFCIWMGVF